MILESSTIMDKELEFFRNHASLLMEIKYTSMKLYSDKS